jgi:NAD(P)-dependent dehydrogenase (short-subunit alcohol dehydrogenase family)
MDVLVTGCSSGFGELIAKTLASAGHHVFATMRDVDTRNASAAEAMRTWARDLAVEVIELDVARDDSVHHAVQRMDHLDVVVNNAGATMAGPIEAFDMEQIQALFNLNAFGPIRVCKAVLPRMRAQRSGLLIFVTSTLGRILPGRGGLYPATKWAAEGLAESLAYQVAPFGIDVAIVEPGSFPTPATSKATPAADQAIAAAYDAVTPRSQPVTPPADRAEPNPQEIADAIKILIDTPAGQRPLRTVVGPVFTEGVAEYNALYELHKTRLADSLRRPDQAITWTPRTAPSR